MQKIKKGDDVVVITGRRKQKGVRAKVLKVLPKQQKVVVEGVNLVTKHVKPTRENQRGGLQRFEAPIHLSNVMLADPKTGEATRVRIHTLESGRKVRVAVKSGEQIDT